MSLSEWVEPFARFCLAGLGLAFVLALYRLIRGPSLPDRVAALDLMALNLIGTATVVAVVEREVMWLDVGIVAMVIGLLGSVSIAQYLVRR